MLRIIFIIFLLFFQISFPQNLSEEINKEFNRAINLYESLQYKAALASFENILNDYDYNSKTTVSLLFAGKILNELERYDDAKENLLRFLELYPESRYLNEARLTLIKSYYEAKDYLISFKEILQLNSSSKDPFYSSYSKIIGEKIALNHLSSSEVKSLYDLTADKKLKSYLLLIMGKISFKQNNLSDAKNYLTELIRLYPESEEKNEAESLYQSIPGKEELESASSLIGVLLPLSGEQVSEESAASASEILEGIKYAVSEFNKNHSNKIGLLIRNTGMERNIVNKIKEEFQNIYSIKSIIGPIYSNEVRAALEIFNETDIPIISPTATDDDLTSLNENFFQANPPFSIRGKVIAQFIYFVENKRNVAVLNAIEGYSPLIASTFIKEFERLGGAVLINETYNSNSASLSKPVSNIAGFLTSLDAIYIPLADKVDAPSIISELVQNQMEISVYGNQDWLHANSLESSSILNNNLTFTSDYFLEFNSEDFQQFNKEFLNLTKVDVNRNVLYGYDTAKYLLTILRNSYSTRKSIRQKMMSGVMSVGYHNNISFGEERVNNFLNILRYNSGRFELIDKFKASN